MMTFRLLHRLFLPMISFATVLTSSGCIDEIPDGLAQDDACTDQAVQEIKGVTTSASNYPEAVWLVGYVAGTPSAVCSGTVVAPRVVLTAGHCVRGYSQWDVDAPHAGSQVASSVKGIRYDWTEASGFINPNQHDIGLLFLDTDIIVPQYPLIASQGTTSNVVNIGVKNNGAIPLTSLYVGQPIAIADGAAFGYPYAYRSSIDIIETGDSGGPTVVPGPAPHTIVAVNSGFNELLDYQVLARVDQLYSWIQDRLRPTSCGPTCPNPIDQSPFFVRQLYLDVLGREPASNEQSFWLNALNSCNGNATCLATTRASIARSFLDSSENRSQYPELNPASSDYKSSFLKHCYWNFLGRQLDTAGFSFWLNALNSSGDYDGIVAGFITSTEYRLRFGAQ